MLEIKNIKLNTVSNKLHADLCVDGRVAISATLEYIEEQLRRNPSFSSSVPKVGTGRPRVVSK